jgi:hypothetical protein
LENKNITTKKGNELYILVVHMLYCILKMKDIIISADPLTFCVAAIVEKIAELKII